MKLLRTHNQHPTTTSLICTHPPIKQHKIKATNQRETIHFNLPNSLNKSEHTPMMSSTTTTTAPKRRPSSSWKELLFRSTIYHRHEARRAQTLLRQGDTRPAFLRVLAPRAILVAAPTVETPPTTTAAAAQPPVLFEDSNVFTLHDVPSLSSATDTSSGSCSLNYYNNSVQTRTSVSSTVLAAVTGAVFSEVAYGARCLRQASPFTNAAATSTTAQPRPQVLLLASTTASATTSEYAATFMLQQQPQQSFAVGRQLSSSSSPLWQGLSYAQLVRRAAPVALLFGVKSTVEQQILQSTATSTTGAISVLSAAVAGAVLGGCRSLVTMKPSTSFATVGRHVAGATLYFSTYEGIQYACRRHALLRNSSSSSSESTTSSWNPWTTITAGALAGVVYESILLCGSHVLAQHQPVATTAAAPHRLLATAVVVRAAPSHALLFLGYEATRQLVSAKYVC